MIRRTFLTHALGVGGLALLPGWLRAASMEHDMAAMGDMPGMDHSLHAAPTLAAADALPRGAALRELPKLANRSQLPGEFKGELIAAPTQVELLAGQPTTFWAYNASLPGPLIEVREGDRVQIRFINQLSQPSTIHWHGLPVPPEQDGNPHDPVPPGGERTYSFNLPKGCAGTYWYHPHPHGHTAEQVFRGLAGAFIVRAADDPLAHISERHLLISDLKLNTDGSIPDNDGNDWMNGREGQFVLINGQHQPQIQLQGPERWRIWNACSARYLKLNLGGHSFSLVGTDGGLIEQAQTLTEILLAPAERIEIIVQPAAQNRNVALNAQIYDRNKMGNVAAENVISLAQISLASGQPAKLPARLRSIADLGPTSAQKRVVFSENMRMDNGQHQMDFLVNGKAFDMQRVDLTSKLGEVELWEISNDSHMDHPFHIHGCQFQLIEHELNGVKTPAPYRAWKDTVNLRPKETVRVKMAQPFKGLRMLHCHILEHENQGMMATLEVI
ncbi:MAG TPA: multicopper oxidase family protein [Pseudomonas sp.]|nr:multicopper oxidase family protein [Pseudomonas sp.]